MYYLFDLEEWSWPEIKEFMKNNGGIPAPLLYPRNGWVKMKKGYITWDTERNGHAISEISKSILPYVLEWATVPKKP